MLAFDLILTAQVSQEAEWWETAMWVLAAILGLIYTFFQIRKSVLESKKLQLEIVTKEVEIKQLAENQEPAIQRKKFRVSGEEVFFYGLLVYCLGVIFVFWLQASPISGSSVVAVAVAASSAVLIISVRITVRVLSAMLLWGLEQVIERVASNSKDINRIMGLIDRVLGVMERSDDATSEED